MAGRERERERLTETENGIEANLKGNFAFISANFGVDKKRSNLS